MKYKKIILGLMIVVGFTSCKKDLEALLNDPNYPSPSTADVDLFLNQVQLSFNGVWSTASDYGGALSRQQQWGGPLYRNAYSPTSFDGIWTNAYTGVVTNSDALIPLAESQNKFIQAGMARTLKAFTMGILVDDFGDVPFSEADQGNANTTPKVDGGAAIYASIQSMLDSAIDDFTKTGAATGPANDLFYGGNKTKWVTFAKTLKLKFYMQTRLVDASVSDKIKALLTENNVITSAGQDFVFKYGTNVVSPDSRHPHYATDYVNSGGVGEYLSNYFMWMVAAQKYGGGTINFSGDPRLRYYFYRQATNYAWANQQSCPCFGNSIFASASFPAWYPSVPDQTPFCVIGKGYMGRDHGDNSGAPPDGAYRTGWGIYPAGGEFDSSQAKSVTQGMGAQGAGISPIWLSSFTSFIQAEAAISLGITTNGTARDHLLAGITASINKVVGFPATLGYSVSPNYAATPTQITNYINLVMSNYDNATTDDQRLNIIETEYFLATWGNGVEPYNNLRRTGKPDNLQPAVALQSPGFFMRSFYYPSVFVNRNSNAPAQKTPGDAVNKVFWDNNPDDFIK